MIWADIETASGTRVGAGPLLDLDAYQQTRRLSRAGNFACQFPLTKSQYEALFGVTSGAFGSVLRRHVRLFGRQGDVQAQIGRGIVESQQAQVSAPSQVTVSLRGDDLLRELAWATVGVIAIEEQSTTCEPLAVYRHDPGADEDIDLDNLRLGVAHTQYIYIGYTDPFSAVHLQISGIGNINTGVMEAQVLRQPGQEPFWDSVTITDGTASGGIPLVNTGTVSWDIPDFWEPMRHNGVFGYWARLRVTNSTSGIDWGSGHEVTGPGPTTGGLATIMGYATGWALDAVGGYTTTGTAVRWRFAGESVLAALIKIAELTGENFRLGENRQVVWLRSDTPTTGIRAVTYSGDIDMSDNSDVVLIVNFSEERSSYDSLLGRLYTKGVIEMFLAQTSKTPPSGYSQGSDARGEYLQHDATWAAYNQAAWYDSKARTPDELFDDAFRELERRKDVYEAYNITVTKLDTTLRPGDLLKVVYQKTQDGIMIYDIDDTFVILEMRENIDAEGNRTAAMRLASKARWPRLSDQEALARLL